MVVAACGGADTDDPLDAMDGIDAPTDPSIDASTDGDEGGGEDGGRESAGPQPAQQFPDAVQVIVANSQGTLTTAGEQRVMTALLGSGPNDFLGGEDQPVTVVFSPVGTDDEDRVEGAWLTTNAAALGLYVSYYRFPSAGQWEIRVEADGRDLGGTLFAINETSGVPGVGDPAPRSVTPVADDPGDIASISTDPAPDPGFYDLTIAEAVGNGRPTVVAFATPAFCQTALCGPTLETVKAAVDGRDELDVVHVEPFDLVLAPAGQLMPIDVMFEWGLATEPWVFVIDETGAVTASFEGILGQAELEAALDRL